MAQGRLYKVRLALWAGAIASVLVAGGAFLWRELSPPRPHEVQVTGEADIRNEYTLTDHTGRAVTGADFAGRWQLLFFGFTYCPDICPTTLAYMASVMDLLGPRAERVAPIFITVDPARDTVPVMAEYVAAFHPHLVGLTGTEAQVAGAARNFRVYFERMEDAAAPDGYLMAHAGYIYVMRPDGRFEAVFREADQPPAEMASEISMRIDKDDGDR
jgi:cytochrome oxidase Cu insertion factor (SCO1/SenC/PrrC family)